jgi:hypothetical protein
MVDGAVWKLNTKTDEWTEITPDKPDPKSRAFGYAAVSVDSHNPDVLIVSSFNRYGIKKAMKFSGVWMVEKAGTKYLRAAEHLIIRWPLT